MGLRWNILAGAGTVVVVAMAALSAPAQSASPYTMPVNTGTDAHAGAPNAIDQVLAPTHSDQLETPDSFAAPQAMPAEPILPEKPKARKGWMEMTPEEIWGLKPSKKKTDDFKSLDPVEQGRLSGRSPLEDMLAEQRHPAGGTENSDASSDNADFWGAQSGGLNSRRQQTMHDASGSLLANLLENTRAGISQPNADSEWAGVFQARQPTQQTPAQQADLQAFREMLNPSLAVEKPKDSSFGGSSLKAPGADPDVEPASAKYHPNGGTYTPLDAGIGRPKRLDPLPTATSAFLVPSTLPSWAPQPPPWKVTAPQLFVEPQRHF